MEEKINKLKISNDDDEVFMKLDPVLKNHLNTLR